MTISTSNNQETITSRSVTGESDSGIIDLSNHSSIPYREGFMKYRNSITKETLRAHLSQLTSSSNNASIKETIKPSQYGEYSRNRTFFGSAVVSKNELLDPFEKKEGMGGVKEEIKENKLMKGEEFLSFEKVFEERKSKLSQLDKKEEVKLKVIDPKLKYLIIGYILIILFSVLKASWCYLSSNNTKCIDGPFYTVILLFLFYPFLLLYVQGYFELQNLKKLYPFLFGKPKLEIVKKEPSENEKIIANSKSLNAYFKNPV
ncbi:hypothetical protein K502DRAFT_342535 [Neoconidiobolus thromboides FSU 785]|nr:hypothetical protein K502DRAFT_342535 [Neoconidiobolus thromboides FSU 785]